MSRRLLAVAFHFPPIRGSSGYHRTLAFAKYLGDFGWRTTVLGPHLRAYGAICEENADLVPDAVRVVRASAWDTLRHLSVGGRYPRAMALPDRWWTWIPGGVATGLRLIRQERSTAILSTFPIASAHVIGLLLHRLTGLPWVADFRDPMLQDTYPADPLVRRSYRWIESRVFAEPARILVTTPGTATYYAERYGEAVARRIHVIPNGYDPEAFPADAAGAPATTLPGRLRLIHSGSLYPGERSPEPFLEALAALAKESPALVDGIEVLFRASGHQERYGAVADQLGLSSHIRFEPALPYEAAIREMLTADALLLFQARSCNRQIPAKAYEYLYAGRPVIGLCAPEGDTGRLLLDARITSVAALEEPATLKTMLARALEQLRAGTLPPPSRDRVLQLSRRARTAELAQVLEEITVPPGTEVPAEPARNTTP